MIIQQDILAFCGIWGKFRLMNLKSLREKNKIK